MTIKVERDAKLEKRPVPYSAGIGGFDLTPEKERVALVLNIESDEVQLVPEKIARRRREYKDNIVRDEQGKEIVTVLPDGEFLTVKFIQPDGFGTMFGKAEDEDGGDPVITALREGQEESGMELGDRIVRSVSHREKPQWGPYFNITYLANCVGMEFRNDLIQDEFVSKTHSGFYPLFALPYRKPRKKGAKKKKDSGEDTVQFKAGMYQAATRRIVALLLQLDRSMLAELNRPGCENADDLVKIVLARVRYFNLFSQRMLKMLVGLKREDLILERLKRDNGIIQDPFLAAHIAANLVLWLPQERLDEAVEALLSRCDPKLRVWSRRDRKRHVDLEVFLGECLIRRKNTLETYADKQTAVSDEKETVEAEEEFYAPEDHTPNYAKMWLAQEAKDVAWRKRAGR